MNIKRAACAGMMSVSFAALLCVTSANTAAAQGAAGQIHLDTNDIGGVVAGAKGPEAGVWVIAETKDLPTKYVKIVVTDDQGRYVLPDLPKANYDIWVRGYGLVDSPKVKAQPGKPLDLKAVTAPSRAAAAAYYPGIYWYSMLHIPDAKLFPGTGPQGNGMPVTLKDQGQWLRYAKTDGCIHCHQIGDLATRTIPAQLGHFNTSAEAWERRIQSGQAGRGMVEAIGLFDTGRQLSLLGDWTDRVAKGELPKTDPVRPTGVERAIVVTEWDWNTPKAYVHDGISTDKRNPTVNANGLIYGSTEVSTELLPWVDPVHNTSGVLKTEYRDPKTPTTKTDPSLAPSPYWGDEAIWDTHTNVHNPMFDDKGRLWLTARIRPAATQPAYCKAGSNHPSAKAYPKDTSNRQTEVYDPKTGKISMIDLCFNTHHLNFDDNGTLWFSAGGPYDVIGWLDTKKWDATHDDAASQGWSPFVIDTNGNGKRDAGWAGLKDPVDPTKDKQIMGAPYGINTAPDGSVYGSILGFPGGVIRFDPKTQLSEYYEVPYKNAKTPMSGFSPRGMGITSDGVVWLALASGQAASFDRRLCKGPLNGPKAADAQNVCPEGWKLYQMPGPVFENLPKETVGATAEAPYAMWVDQDNTLGFGKNIPIATASQSDALEALVDGKWVVMRIPYPMSYYAKGMDGRIDDAAAGWKGKGLFSTYSERAPTHIEGGKGQTSKVVHFQLRPSPLAD
jgi:hypothetical protein